MWLSYLLLTLGFSHSTCWIHDATIIGSDLIQNSVLPVNYFYVQLIDVYGRKWVVLIKLLFKSEMIRTWLRSQFLQLEWIWKKSFDIRYQQKLWKKCSRYDLHRWWTLHHQNQKLFGMLQRWDQCCVQQSACVRISSMFKTIDSRDLPMPSKDGKGDGGNEVSSF